MRHRLVRVLPYAADQLFDLVADVERYPEFVPWVMALSVGDRRQEGEASVFAARADVGFSIIHERFATRVALDRPAREIRVDLLSGPFRRLSNRWSFHPLASGAELVFEIDFQFKSRLLDALLAANQDRAIRRLVACFEARAANLYGARSLS